MSKWLMWALVVQYAIVTGVCIVEGSWRLAMYWAGSMILTSAVILGMRG